MTFVDDLLAVNLVDERALLQLARIGAQTHRAALVLNVLLLGHQVDEQIIGVLVELGGGGTLQAHDVARELAHGRLQAQANAQEGNLVLASVACGLDLALEGTLAETAGNQDRVHLPQHLFSVVVVELLAIDELNVDVHAVGNAGMAERLDDGQVGIGQVDVLAHNADAHLALAGISGGEEGLERGEVDLTGLQAETIEDLLIEALLAKGDGHLVDGGRVDAVKNIAGRNVAEQRDLLADAVRNLVVGAAHDEVRLDAKRP